MATSGSPVSPIELTPIPTTPIPTTPRAAPTNATTSSVRKGSWLPFTLQWYYLVLPTIISLCLGGVLVFLSVYSKQNQGIAADSGSSAILFGWRFTPTLIAVLYAQMTVILFEDVKRTEPFARLAKAPAGGAGAYGTLLQTPRAWWSILTDVCFRRKRIGKTSWTLICAALINVIALLAISPLSSALLTSEEVLVSKAVEFMRFAPKAAVQIPMIPTQDTYYRTLNALLRNVTTSAWVADNAVSFPFWPTTEEAQFGPKLSSSFGSWNSGTTTLVPDYTCQNMTLESADMAPKRYSDVYTLQGNGPLNGTQPMITFVLSSNDGCRYELSMHPAVDMAYSGGVTWSNASTFYPTLPSKIAVGGRTYPSNVTSTHIYARLNTSEQCKGKDILLMSTPWTVPIELSASMTPGFIPQNQTYKRSPGFRMRGLLCRSEYSVSNHSLTMAMTGSTSSAKNASIQSQGTLQRAPDSLLDAAQFQSQSMQNNWKTYFDAGSTLAVTKDPRELTDDEDTVTPVLPGFSGMAPLLSALSNYSLFTMLDDAEIVRKAATIKGRFFTETIRESFTDSRLLTSEVIQGQGVVIESRVVVLTEIGYTLAALFFASAILLVLVFFSSRLAFRPLNLSSDPASSVGLSLMLNRQLAGLSTIRRLHDASRVDLYTALQGEKFLTANGDLLRGDTNTDPPIKVKPKRTWKPSVIRVRMLLCLGLFLTLVLVAVLVLNAFSARSQLSQVAFIYEADISKLGLSFTNFAPISIAPTVVSIILGLWWDQLDMTWRILQPYIAMSRGPTSINSGAGLTYRSKSWAGAAFKAGRNKHWLLCMIAVGSVLAQVLTVSMSALFERETRTVTQARSLPRDLELRQVPLITEVGLAGASYAGLAEAKALNNLFMDVSKNWLYGAGMQQSFNGSQLPWTYDGWSFLPVNLTSVAGVSSQTAARSNPSTTNDTPVFSVNVTVKVPAIRARLDCSVVDEVANVSAWSGLEDSTDLADNYMPDELTKFNQSGKVELYYLPSDILVDTDAHTTVLSSDRDLGCCQNGTATNPQRSVLGYWSPVIPSDKTPNFYDYPYENLPWPLTLTTKWIVGRSVVLKDYNDKDVVRFKDQPRIQMARCEPIIETAEALVTLDAGTGNVHSYQQEGNTAKSDVAWAEVFTRHDNASTRINDTYSDLTQNFTTSFGVLFLDSLLGSADRDTGEVGRISYESLEENAFVFRDAKNGINMDLMSSSMYTLAKQDPEALLNYTTMSHLADLTFQTFFQQFVNSGLSLSKGGYAYQTIQDNSTQALGIPVDRNGTRIPARTFPVLNTNRTITASVSHRIRVLHMNTTATYLSTAILIWLILTTVIVLCLQRRYTSFMNRDVQLVADMLVLIAGSDNFLELVAEKGVELKKNKDVKTMLGWFRDRDGHIRWGVEVVGGRNAVDWVDAPKVGFHVLSGTPSRVTSRSWKCW